MKKVYLILMLLIVCYFVKAQPPANDECAGATVISTVPFGTSCSSSVNGNTAGATQSLPNPSCTSADNNDDIWYSFTANSASVILRFSNAVQTTGGTTYLGYALYSSPCPSTTATLSCSNNIGFGSGYKIIDGLTIGSVYYLRLFSLGATNYMNFDFCVQDVPAPPVNDECNNAISISTQPFGANCTASVSGNTTGSTQSSPNPSCTSTDNNDDIWYSFTANSQSVILRFSNGIQTLTGGTSYLGYALYNSPCPSTTATLSCNTNIGFGSGYKIIDGLTIGSVYYLRLFSLGANNYMSFDFCVQDVPAPPANDECANAIFISTQPFGINCAASVSANTSGATHSTPDPSCGVNDSNDDIWYSFTANSQSIILRFSNAVMITSSGSAILGYTLYEGTCPSNSFSVSCSAGFGFGSGNQIIDGLIIGQSYLLRLFSSNSNNYSSFDFCVQDVPAPPSNNECLNAILVPLTLPGTLCTSTITTNTTGATISANNPSCTANGSNNDDIWFSFTASASTTILRYSNCFETITGNGGSIGYALYNSCPSGTSTLSCINTFGFISGFVSLTGLTQGNTYYLRLFGANPNNYVSFNFCLQSPLKNDECQNAIDIPVSNGFCSAPVLASLNGATTSPGFGSPSCRAAGNSRDVWFKTTIPITGNLIIQTSAMKLAGSDLVMTAYAGACGTLTEIACDDNGNPETAPSANHSRISITGRTPGELILLRVTAAFSGSEEQFAICAWDESLSVLPAVSLAGNCIPGMPRIIDSSQGNIYMWVPLFDNTGNIIAEIYPNGNDLGNITTSLFVNTSGTVRNFNGEYYLDRNVSIQPANNAAARVRIYFFNNEFTALQLADPSITSINNLGISKINTTCEPALNGSPTTIFPNAFGNYGANHYVEFSTPSFSSFYINKSGVALPLKFISFNAFEEGTGIRLDWKVVKDDLIKDFEIQKSNDGINFITIKVIDKQQFYKEETDSWSYKYIDNSNIGTNYYRIKMNDINGKSIYSEIIKTNGAAINEKPFTIYPNPTTGQFFIKTYNITAGISVLIFNEKAQMVKDFGAFTLQNVVPLDLKGLAPCMYIVKITDTKSKNVYYEKLIKK